jgi:rhodanese-related sulfurtransferase
MRLLSSLFPPTTTAQDAHEAVRHRKVVILDVRERSEWKAGHVPRSVNIPLAKLNSRLAELDPNSNYVTVCRSGARSRRATSKLRKAGLNAVNLDGGLSAWTRANLPLEPRNGRVV